MDHIRSITLILLLCISAVAQPFQHAELGWVGTRTKCGTSAANSVLSIAENNAGPAWMHGFGGTFSVTSGPAHGTLSSVDSVNGTATYTPASSYIGADSFTFSVTSGSCVSMGTVYVAVFDTNSTSQTCTPVENVAYVDSGSIILCSALYVDGVLVSSACATQSVQMPAFTGTACSAAQLLCDGITNHVDSLGHAPIVSNPFAVSQGGNWIHAHDSIGPSGHCGESTGSFFFCNNTTNTTLNLSGRMSDLLGGFGSHAAVLYYNGQVVTNLSRGNPSSGYDYTWTATVTIPQSNLVTLTLSNYVCNAQYDIWITNALSP